MSSLDATTTHLGAVHHPPHVFLPFALNKNIRGSAPGNRSGGVEQQRHGGVTLSSSLKASKVTSRARDKQKLIFGDNVNLTRGGTIYLKPNICGRCCIPPSICSLHRRAPLINPHRGEGGTQLSKVENWKKDLRAVCLLASRSTHAHGKNRSQLYCWRSIEPFRTFY